MNRHHPTFPGRWIIAALVATATWGTSSNLAEPAQGQQRELKALFGRIAAAWSNGDAKALANQCTPEMRAVVAAPDLPAGYAVMSRDILQAEMTRVFRNGGIERRFLVEHGWQRPDTSDVVGIRRTVVVFRGPLQGRIERGFLLVKRVGKEWKVCFAFPCFATPRLVVTRVVPGSQAARLGVRKGDVIERYAGRDVSDAIDLVNLARDHASDVEGTQLALVLARAGRRVLLHCPPGPIGVEVHTHLQGDPGTETFVGSEAGGHPAADAIRTLYAAIREQSVEKVRASASEAGFCGFHVPSPDKPSIQLNGENLEEYAARDLEAIARAMKPDSVKVGQFRLVVRGNMAVVSYVTRLETSTGKDLTVPALACLLKTGDTWGLAAILNAGPTSEVAGLLNETGDDSAGKGGE
jgi:ketosteroid isomerase-like protein